MCCTTALPTPCLLYTALAADDIADRFPLDAEGKQGTEKIGGIQRSLTPRGKPQRQDRKSRRVGFHIRGKHAEQSAFRVLIPAKKEKRRTAAMMQDGPRHRLLAFIQKADKTGTRADLTQTDGILHASAQKSIF